MPYIIPDKKKILEPLLNATANDVSDVGDLTYSLYVLCVNYAKRHGLRFHVCCGIMGALLCCALEFYRRVVSPYEDVKIKENGDVVSTL